MFRMLEPDPGNRTDSWTRRDALALAIWPLLAGRRALSARPSLTVTPRAREVAPGELVVLDVTSDQPLTDLSATAFERPIAFVRDDGGGWQALLGIDLDARPGAHPVVVSGRTASGPVSSTYTLDVRGKRFRTRTLTVAPKFVTPPPETAARIKAEGARVAEILATPEPERLWSGAWTRPVPGISLSSFGVRSVFNGQPRNPHTGTDFRAPEGTPIKAPARGRVRLAADHYFSGNQVILDHGQGLVSFFAHMSAFEVREGEMAERGRVLGRAGATGRVTGPHLHWALRAGAARVDALSLLHVLGAGDDA